MEETPLALRLRACVVAEGIRQGLDIPADHVLYAAGKAVLMVATREDFMFWYPANWWQAFKARWFPWWLKKWSPVQQACVTAITKYPELRIPNEMLGQEFVHLEVLTPKELERRKKLGVQGKIW